MGESRSDDLEVRFDRRGLMQFHGAKVTSDAQGHNKRVIAHGLVGRPPWSADSRLVGYSVHPRDN